jgi:hypothetical protein
MHPRPGSATGSEIYPTGSGRYGSSNRWQYLPCEPFRTPGRQYRYGLAVADPPWFPLAASAPVPGRAPLQSGGYHSCRSAPGSVE